MAGHRFTPDEARAAAVKAAPRGPNKTTVAQREAIELAAAHGHPDGLVGYYIDLKATNPDKFSDHMRALIPRDLKIDATVSWLDFLESAAERARRASGVA